MLLFARGVKFTWGGPWRRSAGEREEKGEVEGEAGRGRRDGGEKREERVVKKLVHIVMDPGKLQSAQGAGRWKRRDKSMLPVIWKDKPLFLYGKVFNRSHDVHPQCGAKYNLVDLFI